MITKFCNQCGTPLAEEANFCAECGSPAYKAVKPQSATEEDEKLAEVVTEKTFQPFPITSPNTPFISAFSPKQYYNGFCVAGFVCSFFTPILGIILAIIGISQAKEREDKGKGLGIAGIIISCVFLCVYVFLWIMMLRLIYHFPYMIR